MTELTTHSMLTTFKRCPRQAMYQYVDCLRPKAPARPLRMGTWFHYLLEAHYKGEDWKIKHRELIDRQEELFFEEQIADVPLSCYRLMESYLWYYQLEPKFGWHVLEVELELEAEWPDGTPHKCKLDLLVEITIQGKKFVIIVDHKLRSTFPKMLQRFLDSQSLTYIWMTHKNGIKVDGFMWNYIRMAPPTVPQILKDGTLSKRAIKTDWLTLTRSIKANSLDTREYHDELQELRKVYWRPDKINNSPFFRREMVDKDSATVRRMVIEMYRTKKRLANYDFSKRDAVERVINDDCTWRCAFSDICSTELFGGNADLLRQNHYNIVNPLDYYTDCS
ncbi:MAG: PD-(D/E)XK nuclease family protein [Gloeomargaritales cyanobacterium]